MSGMDMDRFDEAYRRSQENSGMDFGDVEKLVVRNNLVVRLIGSMASVWEHFALTAKGQRPVYCAGPESSCPLCKLCAQWAMSDDSSLQQQGSDMRAKEKYYFNALDRSEQGKALHAQSKKSLLLVQGEKGFNIGSMLFTAIGDICMMRKEQGKSYDPNGFDIMLQKTGTGMRTKYSALPTGDEDPLTEEELQYELYDLTKLTTLTSSSDVESIVKYQVSSPAQRAAAAEEAINFNPQQLEQQANPGDVAKAAMGNQQATQAAPTAPAAAPAPATPPAQTAATAPSPATATATYADTTPTDDFDPTKFYQVPCGDCGKMMQISLTDTTELKCHGCGKVYGHPNA